MLSAEETERAKEAFNHAANCAGIQWAQYVSRLGFPMLRCRGCDRAVPVARLLDQLIETATRRYVLTCIECDQDIRVHRPKPRIPLHPSCARRRREVAQ